MKAKVASETEGRKPSLVEEVGKLEMPSYPGFSNRIPLNTWFLQGTATAPCDLKPRKKGHYEIKVEIVPAGKTMTVVSQRNWLMTGYAPTDIRLSEPRIVHKLIRDGKDLLMSDTPQEMFMQLPAYDAAHGRVLVGGLGLGMYANMIARKPSVTEVVVIEIDPDIIALAKPKNKKIKVVKGDFWEYLKNLDEKFDFIYCDIYYHTGAWEFSQIVLPMRRIVAKKTPVPIMFWGEQEMESQHTEQGYADFMSHAEAVCPVCGGRVFKGKCESCKEAMA